jgi:hypothetical protein
MNTLKLAIVMGFSVVLAVIAFVSLRGRKGRVRDRKKDVSAVLYVPPDSGGSGGADSGGS